MRRVSSKTLLRMRDRAGDESTAAVSAEVTKITTVSGGQNDSESSGAVKRPHTKRQRKGEGERRPIRRRSWRGKQAEKRGECDPW